MSAYGEIFATVGSVATNGSTECSACCCILLYYEYLFVACGSPLCKKGCVAADAVALILPRIPIGICYMEYTGVSMSFS